MVENDLYEQQCLPYPDVEMFVYRVLTQSCAAWEFWLRVISRLNIVVFSGHTHDGYNKQLCAGTQPLSLDQITIKISSKSLSLEKIGFAVLS